MPNDVSDPAKWGDLSKKLRSDPKIVRAFYLAIAPDLESALLGEARLLVSSGYLSEALDNCRRAVRNDPRSVAHAATQDVPRQMEWLKSALSASQAQWKILFAHHPIYSGGGHGDTPELIANVLPLLHEHGVQAYFNGHDHDLQHLRAGKVDLFCTGAGSQHTPTFYTRHSQFAESCSGFTTVSLQPEKMEVRLVDKHGTTVHAATVERA